MALALVWFRRDLRLGDLPTLLEVANDGDRALALFVLDDALLGPAGERRRDALYRALAALDEQLGGRLLVVKGDPAKAVPAVAAAAGAARVHVSADFGPYGARRDDAVALALRERGVELVRTGSPYVVSPGRVLKDDGDPYRVFTPYFRSWQEHGWRPPAETSAETVEWVEPDTVDTGRARRPIPEPRGEMPDVSEAGALAAWSEFVADDLADYGEGRDRIDRDGTSRMSVHLKYGTIHPRTMLAELARRRSDGAAQYRRQLAWRDFYADFLHHRPDTARRNYDGRFDAMQYETGRGADEAFAAWTGGRTGYPIVDAAMRQLAAEGWIHNRLRMIVASFLVKDLHLPWWWGARHFMTQLVDGDLANNQHGWQWTAGTGTDASPYFRVFNPVRQGEKFDPTGEFVRRWVPELRSIAGKAVHDPADRPGAYPEPIVDHAHERRVALARFDAIRSQ